MSSLDPSCTAALTPQRSRVLLPHSSTVYLYTQHIAWLSLLLLLPLLPAGGPWFCVQPLDTWPEGEDERSAILADFSPSVGDRRQELVFIGVGLKEQQLRAALDECLVTVGDMEAGLSGLEDPFEPWPDVEDMIDLGEWGWIAVAPTVQRVIKLQG